MGTARHFDGIDDYLATPSSSESYNGISCVGWVKRDGIGARNGIMGRLFDFHNGWCVFVDEDEFLTFFATGDPVDDPSQFAKVAAPDLSEWTFLAVTYDRFAASQQVKFYAGTSPATVALIGTANRTGGFGELGVHPILVGNIYNGSLLTGGAVGAWNGDIDQPCIYYSALSLAQLKEVAGCGSRVLEDECKVIADITGDDPEPCIQLGSAQSLTVFGTTVVSGADVGCDAWLASVPVTESQLISCM